MAEQAPIADSNIGYKFKTVQLLKREVLGVGAFGKVCKAKCDELTCAAKIIHETLVEAQREQGTFFSRKEHRTPMRRFQQECDFLSTIRHPNVVQYLGTHRDPESGLLVLLMELLDGNLTTFLENAQNSVPFHKQVDICYDISLALAFLHSNNIVHRDLSGKNILMIGNLRAKVTDFGMATLMNLSPHLTHQPTTTTCPGTLVYMPPEALQVASGHSELEKIDCFSFGVITLQVVTRKFPDPGPHQKLVEKRHLLTRNELVSEDVYEIDRRKEHIDQINSSHLLRPIILDCLKNKAIERPSAKQLCERLVKVKQCLQYRVSLDSRVSVRVDQSQSTSACRLLASSQNFLQESEDYRHNMTVLRKMQDKDKEIQKLNEQLKEKTEELERLKEKKCETCSPKIGGHTPTDEQACHMYPDDDYVIIEDSKCTQ